MKRLLLTIFAIALVAGFFGYRQLSNPPPPMEVTETLRIHQGAIVGGIDRENPAVLQFNGIPYAKAARWSPPGPPVQWGADVRDTREFGDECIQPRGNLSGFINDIMHGVGLSWPKRQLARAYLSSQPTPPESEDCLLLNVRTVNLKGATLQPVMVWIHGGSHQAGSGSTSIYQANGLVENGVVLVTINYRLGPLGYLAHPALSAESGTSGNYGLMDQIAALHWVQKNISQFGGDPENVTIFGESAGAQSVSEIMAAPSGDGLYDKAILQSGSSSYNAIHLKDSPVPGVLSAEAVGKDFLSTLADDDASAAELRTIPVEDIIARAKERADLERYYLPTVDGDILPRMIGQSIRDGSVNHVPILAGYNADEASLFYKGLQSPTILKTGLVGSLEDRRAAVAEVFGTNRMKALEALYNMGSEATWDKGATDMLGDDLFGVHMRYLGKKNAAAGKPTWLYFFSRTSPSRKQTIGAYHAAEIPFVFGSHLPMTPMTSDDDRLTEVMGKYWTNFAKTGNPNGENVPDWPAYDADGDSWMELGREIKPINNLRSRKLDIIEEVLEERIDRVQSMIGPFESEEAVETVPIAFEPASAGEQTVANRD